MMNKTFRNLGIGFIVLILVFPFIKIPSYPDVFMCDKARDVCELKSKKPWQSDYHIKKSFPISDIKSMDVQTVKKEVPNISGARGGRTTFFSRREAMPITLTGLRLRLNMKNGKEYLLKFPKLNQKIAEKVSEDFNAYLTSMDEMINITLSAE